MHLDTFQKLKMHLNDNLTHQQMLFLVFVKLRWHRDKLKDQGTTYVLLIDGVITLDILKSSILFLDAKMPKINSQSCQNFSQLFQNFIYPFCKFL